MCVEKHFYDYFALFNYLLSIQHNCRSGDACVFFGVDEGH